VKELVPKNRIITICEPADILGILENQKVHWIATKFMPSMLCEGQKEIALVLGTVDFYK